MTGGKLLDKITITLRNCHSGKTHPILIDVYDNSLAVKWLSSLNNLLRNNYHLEKNYCFFGFLKNQRNGQYLLDQINRSIAAINQADLGYTIDDHFSMDNTFTDDPEDERTRESNRAVGRNIIHEKFNWLHRYFEDLQGVSGQISPYYQQATAETRWHIRQLNLLCHEFESWALSYRREIEAPEWQRPSQLMCWLNSPRFTLTPEDYELFGIETINRDLGGVFVGVNKAVGKHHWEVFNDEGRDSRIGELVSTTLRGQTEATGDFDIEWGRNPGDFSWQKRHLREFREWLQQNGFNPDDPELTIGHPQVGRVDLETSFGSTDHWDIWNILNTHLDVYKISTSDASAVYDYHWSDPDYQDRQVQIIARG